MLTATKNRTANFQWKLGAQWSLDGLTYQPLVDLSAVISANGQVIHPAVSAGDVLTAPHLRFAAAVANSSGSALEQAICSAWVVFVFQT